MIFSLVSRLDEGPLTLGGDDAICWDESVDDDEGVDDDDDGNLEVKSTSVTCGGSVGTTG